MPLPRHLFAPAFRARHLGRSFAFIVGIMVFIATFATAAESALLSLGYNWGQTMESRITVEIPAAGDESTMPQAQRVEQATTLLHAMPGIGTVKPLSDSDVKRLLKPWFDDPSLFKALPLPTLLDVSRQPGATVTAAQIRDNLKNAVPDARVDDHGAWTRDAWRLMHGLTLLGGVTIALAGVTLLITVGMTCGTVAASEHETISLLHVLGADDHDIARHFQAQTERLAVRAAAVAFALALAITGGLMYATRHIADYSALSLLHWVSLAAVLCLIPLCAVGLSTAATRFSVLRLLKSFP
ncbi:MAG: hypothetical protein KGI97_04965 [Alphaproteobacteria bacterium]|nr:hypothetical protein [Alphaproteobacteria bacterium]